MTRRNGEKVSRMLLGASLAVSLAVLQPALAGFGFGGFEKKLTHPAGGVSPALMGQQSKLVSDFAGSQGQILVAQELLAQAFGDKTQAAELAADGNALRQGASMKRLEKVFADSPRADSMFHAQMQKGVGLSAQGRQLYLKALPHYAAGLARGFAMRPDFPNFLSSAENAVASASIMEKLSVKNKLAEGVYVATRAPGYLNGVESTTNDLLTYAKKEKIAVPSNVLDEIPSSP
jgi:hypothetical protein